MASCNCGSCSIDGGPFYTKISTQAGATYRIGKAYVSATLQQLYNDWNLHQDQYGKL